jgi:MYXO-CTERM domain-containing protein
MRRVSAPALLLALLATAAPARALDFWGTGAKTDTWLCPSFCQDPVRGPFGGGELVADAVSDVDDARGEAHVVVSLETGGAISTPTLGASAYSDGGAGSGKAEAFAVEGYTNVGGTTESWTLDITLDGQIFDPEGSDTFIELELVAWGEENFRFSTDKPTLEFEDLVPILDETTFGIYDEATTSVSGSLTFSLAPGESVYVWALLTAEAERNGAWADALNTVTMVFDDPTGLVAASSVPEPGPAALVGLAGLGLVGRARRRR